MQTNVSKAKRISFTYQISTFNLVIHDHDTTSIRSFFIAFYCMLNLLIISILSRHPSLILYICNRYRHLRTWKCIKITSEFWIVTDDDCSGSRRQDGEGVLGADVHQQAARPQQLRGHRRHTAAAGQSHTADIMMHFTTVMLLQLYNFRDHKVKLFRVLPATRRPRCSCPGPRTAWRRRARSR